MLRQAQHDSMRAGRNDNRKTLPDAHQQWVSLHRWRARSGATVHYYGSALAGLRERVLDLLQLIRGNYYHPGFHGSFSIKSGRLRAHP